MPENRVDGELDRRLEAWAEAGKAVWGEVPRELSRTLKASLQPVKPLPSNGALVAQFLMVFAATAAGLMAVVDKAGLHMMTAAQMGAMAALLAGGGVYVATQLVRRMIPGSRVAAPFGFGLMLTVLGVGMAMALLFPWRMPQAFLAEGWPCAALELMIAVPATVLFWLMARRGALFASAGLGAALTALAVFLALLVDQAQCMFPQAPHLLVWHGGMAAVLIMAGGLIGNAMARKRL
jgi:hypothetical protein